MGTRQLPIPACHLDNLDNLDKLPSLFGCSHRLGRGGYTDEAIVLYMHHPAASPSVSTQTRPNTWHNRCSCTIPVVDHVLPPKSTSHNQSLRASTHARTHRPGNPTIAPPSPVPHQIIPIPAHPSPSLSLQPSPYTPSAHLRHPFSFSLLLCSSLPTHSPSLSLLLLPRYLAGRLTRHRQPPSLTRLTD